MSLLSLNILSTANKMHQQKGFIMPFVLLPLNGSLSHLHEDHFVNEINGGG